MLEGGLLVGGVYIVQGVPGAGKTVLANQIAFEFAKAGGQVVYVTLLAESHARMLQHLRRMRFYDSSVIPKNLYYLSGFRPLEEDGLSGLLDVVRQSATSHKAGLLVLDGLVSAEDAAPSLKDYKKFLHELQVVLALMGGTALLLSNAERANGFRPDHTMVDGIIELSNEIQNVHSRRYLHVRKLRGAAQVSGRHSFDISDAGIAVHPRIETRVKPASDDEYVPSVERLGFGIADLDKMMEGGVPNASATMLLGPTGSGKTMLGLQWLAEGARLDETGIYFGFFERPPAILAKSKRVCVGLVEGVERGLVHQLWQRPVEGIVDVVCDRLLNEVERHEPKRLFMDGLDGLATAVDIDDRVREVMTALANELERRGVTILYSAESADLVGPTMRVPFRGVSAITHNMIVLRHARMRGRICRVLSVLKMRDSGHDSTLRELLITDRGILLGDVVTALEA